MTSYAQALQVLTGTTADSWLIRIDAVDPNAPSLWFWLAWGSVGALFLSALLLERWITHFSTSSKTRLHAFWSRFESLGGYRRIAAYAALTLFLVSMFATDYPSSAAAEFWASHALLSGALTTLALLGIGYVAIDGRAERIRKLEALEVEDTTRATLEIITDGLSVDLVNLQFVDLRAHQAPQALEFLIEDISTTLRQVYGWLNTVSALSQAVATDTLLALLDLRTELEIAEREARATLRDVTRFGSDDNRMLTSQEVELLGGCVARAVDVFACFILDQDSVTLEARREQALQSRESRRRSRLLLLAAHAESGSDSSSTAPVRTYLKAIREMPLLTPEEEIDHARRIEAGVHAQQRLERDERITDTLSSELEWIVEDGKTAKKKLLEANLRLVVAFARRQVGRGLPLQDLIQEGNLGLIRAVEKYDHTKGYRFSTYASLWVREAIQRAFSRRERGILDRVETLHSDFESVLVGFGERDAKILRLRYGIDGESRRSLREISQECGATRAHIRRIEQQAAAALASATGT